MEPPKIALSKNAKYGDDDDREGGNGNGPDSRTEREEAPKFTANIPKQREKQRPCSTGRASQSSIL